MFIRTIFAAAIIACFALSGCTHSQWRQFHGCVGDCGGCCHNGLRKAACNKTGCGDCGPMFHHTDGGKYYDSCDGCGDDCGIGCGTVIEPACGMPVEPACGMPVEPGCGVGVGVGGCGDCASHRGCWQPGDLLREIFACDGCTGPMYWSEWYNDPPQCCEPCDKYGNYTGPQYGCSVNKYAAGSTVHQSQSPAGNDPYYDGDAVEPPEPPTDRATRMKSRVVPTSYITPLNSKCNSTRR